MMDQSGRSASFSSGVAASSVGTPATQERQPDQESVLVRPTEFVAFGPSEVMPTPSRNLGLLLDVTLEVVVELGRTSMMIKDVLSLAPGSVVELDKLAGEPVNVLVNGVLLARGEVVVVDEQFGVRITEIVPSGRQFGLGT